MQWPDNAFWDFSLQVYGGNGVPAICLGVQDSHTADINLLLYCAWAGALGHRISAADLALAKEAVGRWHLEIVVALRGLRTMLKTDQMGCASDTAEAIRAEIKSAELNAEHGEQIMLSGVLDKLRQSGGEDRCAAAEFNMRFYLESLGKGLQKADADGLQIIAGIASKADAGSA
ncbi:MAG: TIGR02444 family protein [Rhodospirillaceae bacterium]|jgi:uncharacterized protein (TIGR02444 family)|nr:TIGR02444 family protein [Rhodospirillaceae bacterium]MBT3884013.1 TIGR02444 family protein [Rhodospirillaceae bacterium]MBT4115351.1 TIGR02444 family protein [Rhodospirillaceae bacterium]MBT4670684.1 TIGR02444 family protein [Rhodospirillaceae bacterium]MBT4722107.1 TIGR02444 family protein [Rhodospirillaceae bacterium]